MAKANDAQNPSMEQILQTIRGVISGEENNGQADNDDVLELTEMVGEDGAITSLKPDAAPQAEPTAATPAEPNAAAPDVLANIDNALNEVAPPADTPPSPAPAASEAVSAPVADEHEDDEIAAEPPMPPAPVESAMPELPPVDTPETVEQPVAEKADAHEPKKSHLISDATAAASTKALATLLHNLPKPKVDTPSFQSGLTLEALVVEALKPELSAWLDKNLPVLVTHIVEKEIKKLLPQPEE